LTNGRPKGDERKQRVWQPIHPSDERFARPVRKPKVKPNIEKLVDAEPRDPVGLKPRRLQAFPADVVVSFEGSDPPETERSLSDKFAAPSMCDPDDT